MYEKVYLFLGKMVPVVGAAGIRYVFKCFLETAYVILYESNAEGNRFISRSSALINKSRWHIRPTRAHKHARARSGCSRRESNERPEENPSDGNHPSGECSAKDSGGRKTHSVDPPMSDILPFQSRVLTMGSSADARQEFWLSAS
jgi:hypothetical protein